MCSFSEWLLPETAFVFWDCSFQYHNFSNCSQYIIRSGAVGSLNVFSIACAFTNENYFTVFITLLTSISIRSKWLEHPYMETVFGGFLTKRQKTFLLGISIIVTVNETAKNFRQANS